MVDLGNARFLDKRLEVAALEASKGHAEFVAKADEALSALLAEKPVPHNQEQYSYYPPSEIQELLGMISNAQSLAWALRRFPVFDLSCLKMMRKEKALKVQVQEWNGTKLDFELDLWVPVFAMIPVGGHGTSMTQTWSPMSSEYRGHMLEMHIQEENRKEIQAKVKNNTQVTLAAHAPPVPGGILKKLNLISRRFNETSMIWEAQWSAYARVEDPLIVGRIGGVTFLLDQFDATKLERYVVGEFCKKPE